MFRLPGYCEGTSVHKNEDHGLARAHDHMDKVFLPSRRSSVERLPASPLMSMDSPTASTITSAHRAADTASPKPAVSVPEIVHPWL